MHAAPLPLLVTLVALCGVVALIAAVRRPARPEGVASRRVTRFGDAPWATVVLAMAVAALALWDSRTALLLVFALVSTAALGEFLAPGASNATGSPVRVLGCYLCVPLQYAFVASGRYELFAVALPLFGALALPLLALAQDGGRAFPERIAERYWIVMVCVYCVSYAPALLTLDAPDTSGLVAFLVAMTFACQALCTVASRSRVWQLRKPATMTVAGLAGAATMAALGLMLAWLTPFSIALAVALALLIAAAGALGDSVLRATRIDGAFAEVRWQPGALAFAAPVFFHAARAWTTS